MNGKLTSMIRAAIVVTVIHQVAMVTLLAWMNGCISSSVRSGFTCGRPTFYAILGASGLTAEHRVENDNYDPGANPNDNCHEGDEGPMPVCGLECARAEGSASSECLPDGPCAERQHVTARLLRLGEQTRASSTLMH